MKKIILGLLIFILLFVLVQTFRFNLKNSKVEDISYFTIDNKEVNLASVFDNKNQKLILYIIPDCESCTMKLNEIFVNKKYSKYQIVIVSVGLTKFDFFKFNEDNFKDKNITFLIDKNNTFYKDFGLGFTEEFPTLIEYNLDNEEYILLK